MVILTILAWATQTLLAQWGYGQTTQASGTVEIRCEATIDGTDVTLKQLCRWNEPTGIGRHGDMVIARLSQAEPVKQIGMNEIKSALKDAGVNLTEIQFAGAASCAVRRSEVDDETFARLLTKDVPESTPEKAPVIEAFEPGNKLIPTVPATKPALRKQLVLTRSLSAGQKVIVTDIAVQVLIDKDDVSAEANPDEIIGALLVRDMKPGEVLTTASIKPAPIVTKDQFITVSIPHDGVMIETVARAMSDGIKGQIIEAINEATGAIYNVTVTAPAAAEVKGSQNVASTATN